MYSVFGNDCHEKIYQVRMKKINSCQFKNNFKKYPKYFLKKIKKYAKKAQKKYQKCSKKA